MASFMPRPGKNSFFLLPGLSTTAGGLTLSLWTCFRMRVPVISGDWSNNGTGEPSSSTKFKLISKVWDNQETMIRWKKTFIWFTFTISCNSSSSINFSFLCFIFCGPVLFLSFPGIRIWFLFTFYFVFFRLYFFSFCFLRHKKFC